MKYIRTKDGTIFNVSEICIPYQIVDSWIDFNSQGRFEIVKQADTIEELFDDQIVEYKDLSGKVIKREFINRVYEGELLIGEPEYYGVIRTKMGLHYVARKIEGEWRLI